MKKIDTDHASLSITTAASSAGPGDQKKTTTAAAQGLSAAESAEAFKRYQQVVGGGPLAPRKKVTLRHLWDAVTNMLRERGPKFKDIDAYNLAELTPAFGMTPAGMSAYKGLSPLAKEGVYVLLKRNVPAENIVRVLQSTTITDIIKKRNEPAFLNDIFETVAMLYEHHVEGFWQLFMPLPGARDQRFLSEVPPGDKDAPLMRGRVYSSLQECLQALELAANARINGEKVKVEMGARLSIDWGKLTEEQRDYLRRYVLPSIDPVFASTFHKELELEVDLLLTTASGAKMIGEVKTSSANHFAPGTTEEHNVMLKVFGHSLLVQQHGMIGKAIFIRADSVDSHFLSHLSLTHRQFNAMAQKAGQIAPAYRILYREKDGDKVEAASIDGGLSFDFSEGEIAYIRTRPLEEVVPAAPAPAAVSTAPATPAIVLPQAAPAAEAEPTPSAGPAARAYWDLIGPWLAIATDGVVDLSSVEAEKDFRETLKNNAPHKPGPGIKANILKQVGERREQNEKAIQDLLDPDASGVGKRVWNRQRKKLLEAAHNGHTPAQMRDLLNGYEANLGRNMKAVDVKRLIGLLRDEWRQGKIENRMAQEFDPKDSRLSDATIGLLVELATLATEAGEQAEEAAEELRKAEEAERDGPLITELKANRHSIVGALKAFFDEASHETGPFELVRSLLHGQAIEDLKDAREYLKKEVTERSVVEIQDTPSTLAQLLALMDQTKGALGWDPKVIERGREIVAEAQALKDAVENEILQRQRMTPPAFRPIAHYYTPISQEDLERLWALAIARGALPETKRSDGVKPEEDGEEVPAKISPEKARQMHASLTLYLLSEDEGKVRMYFFPNDLKRLQDKLRRAGWQDADITKLSDEALKAIAAEKGVAIESLDDIVPASFERADQIVEFSALTKSPIDVHRLSRRLWWNERARASVFLRRLLMENNRVVYFVDWKAFEASGLSDLHEDFAEFRAIMGATARRDRLLRLLGKDVGALTHGDEFTLKGHVRTRYDKPAATPAPGGTDAPKAPAKKPEIIYDHVAGLEITEPTAPGEAAKTAVADESPKEEAGAQGKEVVEDFQIVFGMGPKELNVTKVVGSKALDMAVSFFEEKLGRPLSGKAERALLASMLEARTTFDRASITLTVADVEAMLSRNDAAANRSFTREIAELYAAVTGLRLPPLFVVTGLVVGDRVVGLKIRPGTVPLKAGSYFSLGFVQTKDGPLLQMANGSRATSLFLAFIQSRMDRPITMAAERALVASWLGANYTGDVRAAAAAASAKTEEELLRELEALQAKEASPEDAAGTSEKEEAPIEAEDPSPEAEEVLAEAQGESLSIEHVGELLGREDLLEKLEDLHQAIFGKPLPREFVLSGTILNGGKTARIIGFKIVEPEDADWFGLHKFQLHLRKTKQGLTLRDISGNGAGKIEGLLSPLVFREHAGGSSGKNGNGGTPASSGGGGSGSSRPTITVIKKKNTDQKKAAPAKRFTEVVDAQPVFYAPAASDDGRAHQVSEAPARAEVWPPAKRFTGVVDALPAFQVPAASDDGRAHQVPEVPAPAEVPACDAVSTEVYFSPALVAPMTVIP